MLPALVLSCLVLLYGATLHFDWWGLGSTIADAYRVIQPRTIFRRGREGDRRIAGLSEAVWSLRSTGLRLRLAASEYQSTHEDNVASILQVRPS